MTNRNGPLDFAATIDDSAWNRTVNRMTQQLTTLNRHADREGQQMDQTFARIGQLAAGYFSVNALAQFTQQLVGVRGEFQQIEIAYSTMLKSSAKGKQLLAESAQLAATTPFGLQDVAGVVKQYIAYGGAAKDAISTVRMLGDVAAGTSQPLTEVAYLYNTLMATGKATLVDLKQFAGRGIDLTGPISKILKVTGDESESTREKINKLATDGKISADTIRQAFEQLTSNGGIFEGMTEKQSKSLTGMTSNLGDAYDQMLNKIGESNEGVLAGGIKAATTLVENYEPVLKALEEIVIVYGAYRASIIAVGVAQTAANVAGQVGNWLSTLAGTKH